MPYPIEKKFVVAVSSSALFDMRESNEIFVKSGVDVYRKYQTALIDTPLEKGVAFPFIKRLLYLNSSFSENPPIEVVLFSKNSPETGLRAFRSIKHYNLDISRACFSSGKPNFQYLPSFNAALFLSDNEIDAKAAIRAGYVAGTVINGGIADDENDKELRLSFDFDGVIGDDSAEAYYKEVDGDMNKYHEHERNLADTPLHSGPIGELLKQIALFHKMERKKQLREPEYMPLLKTSIVTARNAPAHERVVTTLRDMNVEVDEVFFLGGIDKSRVLSILKPHIFFDDQMVHLEKLKDIPAVHIPFGVANK